MKTYLKILGLCFAISLISCSEDDTYVPLQEPVQVSPVVFDMDAVPYQTLSEYNFFEGALSELNPVYGVLPYDLINPLFSDYAKKKRFIWMPSDVKAAYVNDFNVLDFPLGTILIKNFYYNNVLPNNERVIIETRLMINKPEGWVFANYVWNEEQTEATFDLNGSFKSFEWTDNGTTRSVNYRIPAGPECHTCHKIGEVPIPIGPKPQNLNRLMNFDEGAKNQLDKLVEFGYLENNLPQNIYTMPAWDDESEKARVDEAVCVGCGICADICPENAIVIEDNLAIAGEPVR